MKAIYREIFTKAGRLTGKTTDRLRKMAAQVFASMLHRALEDPGQTILTSFRISPVAPHRIECEVDIDLRHRPRQSSRESQREHAPARSPKVRACLRCRCTDDNACIDNGDACWWIAPNLCSACATPSEKRRWLQNTARLLPAVKK